MFKNVIAFRLASFDLSAEDLEEKLKADIKKPVGPQEVSRMGFSSPFGRASDVLVHSANGCYLMCLAKEEKIIPGPVVKELLEEKVEAIEYEQSRKVRSKEKAELKEQIVLELLPKAFTKTTKTFGYVDTKNMLLIVDAGSAKKAEDFASFIRKSIGSLKARHVAVEMAPGFVMTGWLKETVDVPAEFSIGGEASLVDPSEDGGTVNVKNIDLVSEEIQNHLDNGLMVKKMGVSFDNKLSFVLTDEIQLKKIKFGEEVNQEIDDQGAEDQMAYMDASFTIVSGVIAETIEAVLNAFGGEDNSFEDDDKGGSEESE